MGAFIEQALKQIELKTLIQNCHIHPKTVFRQSRWAVQKRIVENQ